MNTFSLLCLCAALTLSSCGKDPTPAAATSAQTTALPAPAGEPLATATQTSTTTVRKPQPNAGEAAYCPVIELSGQYRASSVSCESDGKPDKIDGAFVPSEYGIAADGVMSGTLSMKISGKLVVLSFPRNPNTWSDFRKNGTQCANGATKGLSQRCPGSKASSCAYTLVLREGKLTATFERVSGTHTYECRSELSAIE